jgi:hypothetical protein
MAAKVAEGVRPQQCSQGGAAIGRYYKQVIGDELRSLNDGRRSTVIGVAVHVLNCLRELELPIFVHQG